MQEQKSVLLLSMNYTPIKILSWKKAVGLVIGRAKADVVVDYNEQRSRFNAAVIKLNVSAPDIFHLKEIRKFSKKNIFLRDQWICQYCAKELTGRDATVDHVVPRARGGKTTYLNCVAACRKCNWFKNDRTPDECEMPLIKPVRNLTRNDMFNLTIVPNEWKEFI
jgi:hypothetical protein